MNPKEEKDTRAKEPMPIGEGLFEVPSSPSEKPYLIGSQCRSCGEVFFPSRACCRRCSSEDMEKKALSRTAKLFSFSTVRVKPPHFIGEIPYRVGVVELPEGERIRTLLTDYGEDSLEIGMEMELVIEIIGKANKPFGKIETGNEVIGWKFRPLRRK